jgi:hypothetical protein
MKKYGEWMYSSSILNLSTRWWAISFTPRPLYTEGKSLRYPLDRRLGGPQNLSGRCGEEKNPLLYQESNPGRAARSYTDWAIPVPKCYIVIALMHIKQTERNILTITVSSSVYNQKLRDTKKQAMHIGFRIQRFGVGERVLTNWPLKVTESGGREHHG